MRLLISFFLLTTTLAAQQITIPRVEMMPNLPSPYEMRDWRQVALGYDSLVFDVNKTGTYLPLSWIRTSPENYPEHPGLGIDSYIGTFALRSEEAINVLPAVIGATLAGVDKSDQNGANWVLMCEQFFNRRPEENVYLNNPVARSGSDWWYDTMPNVFFYQLYDLYPGTGDFEFQFRSVADRWLQAVHAMGASTTPWTRPNMNHRAWYLSTMTPNDNGVRQPEAAGAIAWLLYQAFMKTGAPAHRIGAELAMEYLSGRDTNPSYELQLPYGAYAAARMNAELHTRYNVEKIVNWSFDVGSLRRWGVIVGNWGGYDCAGLVGEAVGDGDYAFAMNGFEQVGALVPLVRYDDRFARAIGKWVLNVANASRLFYWPHLPPEKQDSESWSQQYDPQGVIAYEALRRDWNGQSPFATGDALRNGWAATNLGLYGASHVGILGGIIDTTGVPMILKLDALKTDYFHAPAYPTFLFFNPYGETRTVLLETGVGPHDVYDAVSNRFVLRGVSGAAQLPLPTDAAVLAVIVPAGGSVTYELDHMLIDGVVVDYRSGQAVTNYPPRIKALAAAKSTVQLQESVLVYCTAEDRDDAALNYTWSASAGKLTPGLAQSIWTAPDRGGTYDITCIVSDGRGAADTARVRIQVIENTPPQIQRLQADPDIIDVGESTRLTCTATDADGDSLRYFWSAAFGALADSGAVAHWTAPEEPGYYWIACQVQDGQGGQARDSVGVTVGRLVGFYPFDGDARDASGFGNHGIVSGASPTDDRFGNPASAYFFDGEEDHIRIPVHPSLQFTRRMSLNFWLKIARHYDRETFPISHGSWQNRWKVSIIPGKKLRWTLNTKGGILDLDSKIPLQQDSLYMVTVTYGYGRAKIYLNGVLNASRGWPVAAIRQAAYDLTIGQMLPGDTHYNFRGVIDDVRIYNDVLSEEDIRALYDVPTGIDAAPSNALPATTALRANYPNPFNPATTLRYDLAQPARVELAIFNALGQKIRTLVSAMQSPGPKHVLWDGRDDAGAALASGVYVVRFRAGEVVQHIKILMIK